MLQTSEGRQVLWPVLERHPPFLSKVPTSKSWGQRMGGSWVSTSGFWLHFFLCYFVVERTCMDSEARNWRFASVFQIFAVPGSQIDFANRMFCYIGTICWRCRTCCHVRFFHPWGNDVGQSDFTLQRNSNNTFQKYGKSADFRTENQLLRCENFFKTQISLSSGSEISIRGGGYGPKRNILKPSSAKTIEITKSYNIKIYQLYPQVKIHKIW
jgi:hypothetical protein